MALVALLITIVGFGPALLDTSSRKAPLTLAVGAHGGIYALWLLFFLSQTLLVSRQRVDIHRRLGYAGAGLAVLMVVSGYSTSIAMARRGYDLSGDLNAVADPLYALVFQLGDLASFSVLVSAAVMYRYRPAAHKRLMLFATIGALMPASLAHIIGHSELLREIKAPIILVPLTLLLLASAIHDRLTQGRIHPVSLWAALSLFVWANLRAAVIGPSDAWHVFAAWLIR
jgi:hypothetical protein